jgi:hypothetical protein
VRNTAELLAEFRGDLESFVSLEVVEARVGSYYEMAPATGTNYYAFTDPSGGSDDSFTLSISHRDGERVTIDCIREVKPPLSPEHVIDEFVSVLKSFRCHRVTGDRYGGEFPREQFRKRGVSYVVSEKVKSDIYVDFLPLLNSGRVMLPRNEKLVGQLCSLERTCARGSGKDTIDHPRDRGMHDDVCNAAAGAAVLAAKRAYPTGLEWVGSSAGSEADADAAAAAEAAEYQAQRFQQHVLRSSGYYNHMRW